MLEPCGRRPLGAYERRGLYVIRATRDGFTEKEVAAVRVEKGGGECPHVAEVRLTTALAPEI